MTTAIIKVDGGYKFAQYDRETARIAPQNDSRLLSEDDLVLVDPVLTLEQIFSGAPENDTSEQDIELHERNRVAALEVVLSIAKRDSDPWPYFSVDFRTERVTADGQHKIVCVVQQYTGNAIRAVVDDLNRGLNPHRGPFSG